MATKANTNESNERTITPAMIAEELHVSPKALRSFVRSITSNSAGKGGAWRFTADEATMIKDRYTNRATNRATAPTFIDPAE